MGLFSIFKKPNKYQLMSQTERVELMRSASSFRYSVYWPQINAYLMMLIYDDDLIYFNDKDPAVFANVTCDENDRIEVLKMFGPDFLANLGEFPGRLYKIVIKQSDGHSWSIFYGIKTDDPITLSNTLNYGPIANFVVSKLIQIVPSDFLDLSKMTYSRTDRVYTCWRRGSRYMISNMSGSDEYTIEGFSLKRHID